MYIGTCPICKGTGEQPRADPGPNLSDLIKLCTFCNGQGWREIKPETIKPKGGSNGN